MAFDTGREVRFRRIWALCAASRRCWTDPTQQRPVGETSRHEPKATDAIIATGLERALADPDPLRGIADLVARLAAAFVLDPDGVTRTKVLGRERLSRKLDEALPSGDQPLRDALWTFLRPMLSHGSPTCTATRSSATTTDAAASTSPRTDANQGSRISTSTAETSPDTLNAPHRGGPL